MVCIENKFDKEITNYMKTLAIMLMVIHHMWAYKHIDYFPSDYVSWIPYLEKIGEFGKICVGIFMLLAGYGSFLSFSRKKENGICKFLYTRTFAVYTIFIVVFVFSVPLYVVLSGSHFDSSEIISNLFLVSNSINGTWWFLQTYILVTMFIPLMFNILMISKWRLKLIILLFLSTALHYIADYINYSWLHYLCFYQIYYVFGTLLARFNLINLLCRKKMYWHILLFILGGLLKLAGFSLANILMIVAIISLVIDIKGYVPTWLNNTILFLGSISTYMWLCHNFFIKLEWFNKLNPIIGLVCVYLLSMIYSDFFEIFL